MGSRIILCGLLLATSGWSIGAGEKVTMNASPEVSFAPAHLIIRTAVEPDPENRALEIAIDSDDFYRSSLIELEGDRAPRTSFVEFRDIPSGDYEIYATLYDQAGKELAVSHRMVNVIAAGR